MTARSRRLRSFASAIAVSAALAAGAGAQEPCKLTPIGTATVAAVRDGRTMMLTDGRELRLAAIEAPESARAALQQLAGSGALRLAKLGADRDRYGRLVAFAFAGDAGPSLQQALLAQGQARVGPRVGDRTCALSLFAAERTARSARHGLWADPNFAPIAADNLTRIQSKRGHFALVEGKALSVRESGATIYVNFGRRWTRDFTIVISRRLQGSFAAAGVAPKSLKGRRIRVRGYIEQRSGPIIEAAGPEQIELIE